MSHVHAQRRTAFYSPSLLLGYGLHVSSLLFPLRLVHTNRGSNPSLGQLDLETFSAWLPLPNSVERMLCRTRVLCLMSMHLCPPNAAISAIHLIRMEKTMPQDSSSPILTRTSCASLSLTFLNSISTPTFSMIPSKALTTGGVAMGITSCTPILVKIAATLSVCN